MQIDNWIFTMFFLLDKIIKIVRKAEVLKYGNYRK